MAFSKKILFIIWYFIIWSVCTWALYEFFYPHTDYGAPVWGQLVGVCSFGLLLVTGVPVFLYLRKHVFGVAIMLIVMTLLLTGFLCLNVYASVENKSRVQWYINDLQQQGFNVQYAAQYPYGHWHVNRVNSYADVASTARSINATTIYVYGGAPMSFMFFMSGEVEISFWTETGGYYICYAYP